MPRGIYARKSKPRRDTDRATNVFPFPRNPDVAGAITEETVVKHDSETMQSMKDRIAMLNTELQIAKLGNELLERRGALYERLLDKLSR